MNRILNQIILWSLLSFLFISLIFALYCMSIGQSPRDNYNPTFKHQKMVVVVVGLWTSCKSQFDQLTLLAKGSGLLTRFQASASCCKMSVAQ